MKYIQDIALIVLDLNTDRYVVEDYGFSDLKLTHELYDELIALEDRWERDSYEETCS